METHILSTTSNQDKESYFKAFIKSLVEKFHPLQILCFAKKTTEVKTSGCFAEQQTNHYSDYCLLLVTETNVRIDFPAQDFAYYHFKLGTVTTICYGKQALSEAIKANSRFFITIYAKGELLYSRDGMGKFDFNTQFIPINPVLKARKHYDYRISLAEAFLRGAAECLNKQHFEVSTFMLHQCIEQCCIVLIRVHIGYKSEIHNLRRLLGLCNSFSDKPKKLFLSGSTEDEQLFELLMESYSGARYKSDYLVGKENAEILYDRASRLVQLTKEMCLLKIKELEDTAIQYGQLPATEFETADHQLAGELL